MKKQILAESEIILRQIPLEQLKMFDSWKKNEETWTTLKEFVRFQKAVKTDEIYRLRRPRSQDEMVRNAIEHEYYAARISSLVVLLQIAENAEDEMNRREKKEEK